MKTLKKIITLLITIAVILPADLGTKYWAENYLKPLPWNNGHQLVVIPGFWSFCYVENRNIGFSFLSFLDEFISPLAKRILIIILQLGAASFLAWYYFRDLHFSGYFVPVSMLIASALGNALDRIIRGYVVDFVMWYAPAIPLEIFNPWPIFNIADSMVVIGVCLLGIQYFFFDKNRHA
ncbi:MAG TPA: signal peptidase II [Spirochaetia bacterium]|nr:signal peptidase II [Spirochaetia bacterium]